MKKKNEILGTCIALGVAIGIVFGNIFEINQGKGIAIGMGCGIAIGSIIAKSKAKGSEQAEEDGELMTDEEEKQVWEEFQGKVEEDKDGTS